MDELLFHRPNHRFILRIQKRDLQQVVILEYLARHPQVFRDQPDGGDAAPLAVAAVVHLPGGFENVFPANRDGTGQSGYPAAAFFLHFGIRVWRERFDQSSSGGQDSIRR